MSTTLLSPTTGSAPATSVKDLAGAAKADRNRAIDLYRALAMLAVSIGHWAAIVMTTDADGELVTGNALEFAPSMSWLTWILQVMPLFFVVGGFSSAMSLDSHNAKGGRPQDWVAARLRRMENGEPRRFILTMGGAGAQRELFKAIVDHCRPMIDKGELTLFVNLGDHADNWEWLEAELGNAPVTTHFEPLGGCSKRAPRAMPRRAGEWTRNVRR